MGSSSGSEKVVALVSRRWGNFGNHLIVEFCVHLVGPYEYENGT